MRLPSFSKYRNVALVTIYFLVLLTVHDIFMQKDIGVRKLSQWRSSVPSKFNVPEQSGDVRAQLRRAVAAWERVLEEQLSKENASTMQQVLDDIRIAMQRFELKAKRELRRKQAVPQSIGNFSLALTSPLKQRGGSAGQDTSNGFDSAASISEVKHSGESDGQKTVRLLPRNTTLAPLVTLSGASDSALREAGTAETLEFGSVQERGLRAYTHFIAPQRRPAYRDLTLTTLVTRVENSSVAQLSEAVRAWGGPVSCSVWLSNTAPHWQALEELRRLVRAHGAAFAMTSFHVLWTTSSYEGGPQPDENQLLRVALAGAETRLVLAADRSLLIPSHEMLPRLWKLVNEPAWTLALHLTRSALVVPLLQPRDSEQTTSSTSRSAEGSWSKERAVQELTAVGLAATAALKDALRPPRQPSDVSQEFAAWAASSDVYETGPGGLEGVLLVSKRAGVTPEVMALREVVECAGQAVKCWRQELAAAGHRFFNAPDVFFRSPSRAVPVEAVESKEDQRVAAKKEGATRIETSREKRARKQAERAQRKRERKERMKKKKAPTSLAASAFSININAHHSLFTNLLLSRYANRRNDGLLDEVEDEDEAWCPCAQACSSSGGNAGSGSDINVNSNSNTDNNTNNNANSGSGSTGGLATYRCGAHEFATAELVQAGALALEPHLQVFPNFARAVAEPERGEVTLAVQIDLDHRLEKMERLVELAERWNGWVSVAVAMEQSAKALGVLGESILAQPARLHRTSFHIVYGDISPHPINHLRNLAVDAAQTDLVLLVDVDLVPSPGMRSAIDRWVRDRELSARVRDRKGALVVPVFEKPKPHRLRGAPEVSYQQTLAQLPESKAELQRMFEAEELAVFHDYFPPAHLATDYARWFKAGTWYNTSWAWDYEPYVVVEKGVHGLLPRFLAALKGFGYNKAGWVQELHLANYSFVVLPDVFFTHIWHVKGGKRRAPSMQTHSAMRRYRKELAVRYEVPEHYTMRGPDEPEEADPGQGDAEVEADEDEEEKDEEEEDEEGEGEGGAKVVGKRALAGEGAEQGVVQGRRDTGKGRKAAASAGKTDQDREAGAGTAVGLARGGAEPRARVEEMLVEAEGSKQPVQAGTREKRPALDRQLSASIRTRPEPALRDVLGQ